LVTVRDAAALGDVEASREQSGARGGGAGVGEKFGAASLARGKDAAERVDGPMFRIRLARKWVVENNVRRSGSIGHRLQKIAFHEHPTQSRVRPRLPRSALENFSRTG